MPSDAFVGRLLRPLSRHPHRAANGTVVRPVPRPHREHDQPAIQSEAFHPIPPFDLAGSAAECCWLLGRWAHGGLTATCVDVDTIDGFPSAVLHRSAGAE